MCFFIFFCLFMPAMINTADGYARLVEPPNRSSLWRENFPFSRFNLNDTNLNCGGEQVPYIRGLTEWCGACGDPLYGGQSHLFGGNYVRRYTVTRQYKKGAQYIDVRVDTDFQGGLFEFRICPHEYSSFPVTKDCFDAGLLEIKGFGYRYYVMAAGYHDLELVIPTYFSCNHCVLQWRYLTANYSKDCQSLPLRRMCVLPEEYYNCADIAIEDGAGSISIDK
ncbi:hypothetical protein SNE40_003343 [Patella caerulea]|uniref:Chitin-binding type-4 domain-containing protein n=1 Tax=Patella caerulea TaxID=87958 RepID=A0AAN8K7T1_PATCE